ncbi:DUF3124 domain-containing protein [Wenyingzhuangia sp. 2_MG-2023]|uniref:DUF3124 domain-containing protein n=1 Tax=Wenyingzhuangia sp. 2_MG-2023 TaxID=3062639 RepID=UPI0030151FC6
MALLFQSCQEEKQISSTNPTNWNKRIVNHPLADTLTTGISYLSVYPQIYSQTEHRTHSLTVTVSMRNTNRKDTLFIEKAEFFNTHGKLIRTYFKEHIFIAPMETVEIVIDEVDKDGGTGANFLFDWKIKPNANEPLFEGVMISTSGQQGLSFTTQGKRIE